MAQAQLHSGRPPTSPNKEVLVDQLSKVAMGSREFDCDIEKLICPEVTYYSKIRGRMKNKKGILYTVPRYTSNMMELRPHIPKQWAYTISHLGPNKSMVRIRNRKGTVVCEAHAKSDELAFCIAVIRVL